MAYAKTAPSAHCRPGACFFPMEEQGTSDKRTEAAILTPQKVRKKWLMPNLHLWCIALLFLWQVLLESTAHATNAQKRTKTATIETRRKFEKNGLCQNCTNGALQAWSLLFSVAGPMEEQDTSDKRTKPAMLCHSCAGDMLYVIAKHTYTFGTSLVLQCSPRAHQRKPKTCQNMFRSCQCHAKSLFKQNKGSRFTKTQFATQITQESQEDQGQPKKGVNFHIRSKHFFC